MITARRVTIPLVARPRSVDEALDVLAADPDALLVAGGTDMMVALNAGRLRPHRIVALGEVAELREWAADAAGTWLGAGLTFPAVCAKPVAFVLPALAQAVGSAG